MHKILCICPKCGQILRLSDLKLKAKGKSEKTWLDRYDDKLSKFMRKEEKFEQRKAALREEAVKKGRKEARRIFNKAISPTVKALKYNPNDIIPILNPIDFLVFHGMNKGERVKEIVFLSQTIKNDYLNNIRNQVRKAINKDQYEWQLARIDNKGKISME